MSDVSDDSEVHVPSDQIPEDIYMLFIGTVKHQQIYCQFWLV